MSLNISGDGAKLPSFMRGFVEEARARLEQRRAEAEIEFHRGEERLITAGDYTDEEIEMLIVQYVSARFFAFAQEALTSDLDTARARQLIERSLPALIKQAFLTKHRAALSRNRNEKRRRFYDMARFMITHSDEWPELQEALVERAKQEQDAMAFVHAAELATISFMSGRKALTASVGEATPAATGQTRRRRGRPRTTPNLHPEVEGYLEDVSRFAKSAHNSHPEFQRDIIIADFWGVAGFPDDTVFSYWRRGDTSRCPEAHAQKFQNTLQLKPVQFLDRLAQIRQ
jgi:hypothetical protein